MTGCSCSRVLELDEEELPPNENDIKIYWALLSKKNSTSSYLTGPTVYGKITSGPSEAQRVKFDTCNVNQCANYEMLEILGQGCNALFPFSLTIKIRYFASQCGS